MVGSSFTREREPGSEKCTSPSAWVSDKQHFIYQVREKGAQRAAAAAAARPLLKARVREDRKISQVPPAVTPHAYAGPTELTPVWWRTNSRVRERGTLLSSQTCSTNGSSVDLVYGARNVKLCERDMPTYAVYLVRLEWTCEQTRQTSPRRSWTDITKGNDTLPQTAVVG